MAMVANGDAWIVGERYDENGARNLAVAVGMARPNGEVGHIRIGEDYFPSVLRDYRDWKERWWREAIQNAVDAGAKQITCAVQKWDDGSYMVQCIDNGRGMDRETILTKFLVLGGTTKRAQTPSGAPTAGGFGKAKELLLLPWISWQIQSRDVHVSGQGGAYEVESAGGWFDGTAIRAVMPADRYTDVPEALAYIGKCNLPGVTFELIGEDDVTPRTVRASLRTGKEIRTFDDKAILYQNKSATFRGLMLVRVKGLSMFTRRVADAVEGTLIMELQRPSIELLTANRDGFSDDSFGWAIDRFVNELAADVKSALRAKKGMIRQRYRGTGMFTADDRQAAEARANWALDQMRSAAGGGSFVIDGAQADSLANEAAFQAEPTEETELSLAPTVGALRAMMDGLKINGPAHVEAIAKQAAWQPDFYIYVDDDAEGFRVQSKFEPGKMSPSNVKLAKFWAELCRFVLIQLGSTVSYGVGWIFSAETAAAFSREEGERWLLLNPFRNSKLGGDLLSLGNKDDVAWLYAAAIHECTHMADGVSYHDESFAAAMTRNVSKCAHKWRQVEAIRKAVVSRKALKIPGRRAEERDDPTRACPIVTPAQAIILGLMSVYAAPGEFVGKSELRERLEQKYRFGISIDRWHNLLARFRSLGLTREPPPGDVDRGLAVGPTPLAVRCLDSFREASPIHDAGDPEVMGDLAFRVLVYVAIHQPVLREQVRSAIFEAPSPRQVEDASFELELRHYLTHPGDMRAGQDPVLDATVDEMMSLVGMPGEMSMEEGYENRFVALAIDQKAAQKVARWFL